MSKKKNTLAILLNGPKLCGKDSAIDYLIKEKEFPLIRKECKGKLHILTQQFFCISATNYWEIYNDRDLKEAPCAEFSIPTTNLHKLAVFCPRVSSFLVALPNKLPEKVCLSIREAMIYVSEVVVKPNFGMNYFGVARASDLEPWSVYIDGSCGFAEELPPLIEELGQENILLLRIHREGCTWEGDSRSYIEDGVLDKTIDIYNNGTEEEYNEAILEACLSFEGSYL